MEELCKCNYYFFIILIALYIVTSHLEDRFQLNHNLKTASNFCVYSDQEIAEFGTCTSTQNLLDASLLWIVSQYSQAIVSSD
jgi:hypothetical protein